MKKSILLMCMTGLCGAASAQSSVTLSGVVDASLSRGTGSRSSVTQMLRSGLTSNRLIFRGVEDLGGGMSASFWLEAGFNVDDGTGQASNSNNQASGTGAPAGLTFNRRSTVALAGAWGEVRLGRDYVPQYYNYSMGDPFFLVGVGAPVNFTAAITGITLARASNGIFYYTPRTLGGFAVHAAHYLGENPSGTPTSGDGTGSGVRVTYETGPFAGGLAWSHTKYAAGDVQQRNAVVTWDFGPAKVFGTYNNDRNGIQAAKGGSLGALVPVGVGEFKALYSIHRPDLAGAPEAKKISLGYVHNLSKRTALYSTIARVSNAGGLALALNGATTAPNQRSSGIDLGLRHIF